MEDRDTGTEPSRTGQVSTDAGHGARDPGLSPKAVSLHGLIPTSRPRSWQIWMSTEIPKSHISILLTRSLLKTSAPSQAWSKLRLSWRKVLILQGRADLEAELGFTAFDSKSVRAGQKCQTDHGKGHTGVLPTARHLGAPHP